MESKLRIAYKGTTEKIGNHWKTVWKQMPVIDIKRGDIFKMTEVDGTPVTHENGKTTFIAKTDAYIDPLLKIPTIDIHL